MIAVVGTGVAHPKRVHSFLRNGFWFILLSLYGFKTSPLSKDSIRGENGSPVFQIFW